MPFLLSVVGMVSRGMNLERQAAQKVASGFGEFADNMTTPLGNAAPFEYIKSTAGDDVLSIAARGVSEAQEADCYAMYNFEMEQCNFAGAIYNDPRTYALCKQNAFSNFQSCRGY